MRARMALAYVNDYALLDGGEPLHWSGVSLSNHGCAKLCVAQLTMCLMPRITTSLLTPGLISAAVTTAASRTHAMASAARPPTTAAEPSEFDTLATATSAASFGETAMAAASSEANAEGDATTVCPA
jgi:hypothetical protein